MTTNSLQRKAHSAKAPTPTAARGARVVVSFKNVPALSKAGRERLEAVARDPNLTKRRMFPTF